MSSSTYASLEILTAIIVAVLFFSSYRKRLRRRSNYYFFYMALSECCFLFIDAYLFMTRATRTASMIPVVKVLSFGTWVWPMLAIAYFHFYMTSFLREYKGVKVKTHARIMIGYTIFMVAAYLIADFCKLLVVFDANGVETKTKYYNLLLLIVMLPLIWDWGILLSCHKKVDSHTIMVFGFYVFCPIFCLILQAFFGIMMIAVGSALAIVILYTDINQETELRLQEQQTKLREKEIALKESKMKVMMSQIQPHFLYNVLNTICIFCQRDPKLAAKTTSEFATYLRTNLNASEQTEPISFKEELQHTMTYLELEKLRFGDALNIELDIKVSTFYLPILTLQPIVENAVKHGICMKDEDGTLKIATYETADNYVISICDDGVGFDVEKVIKNGKFHCGVESTRIRVEQMCGGSMHIESQIGQGTQVTITLPKKTNASFSLVSSSASQMIF